MKQQVLQLVHIDILIDGIVTEHLQPVTHYKGTFASKDSGNTSVSFVFNECIRTACLITGQMIMPYHSGILQTKVPTEF
jgi:hypothetical protein